MAINSQGGGGGAAVIMPWMARTPPMRASIDRVQSDGWSSSRSSIGKKLSHIVLLNHLRPDSAKEHAGLAAARIEIKNPSDELSSRHYPLVRE
jgi:hypothetical protein